MCGIFGLLNNNNYSYKLINKEFTKGSKRGPEFSCLTSYNNFLQGGGIHSAETPIGF